MGFLMLGVCAKCLRRDFRAAGCVAGKAGVAVRMVGAVVVGAHYQGRNDDNGERPSGVRATV